MKPQKQTQTNTRGQKQKGQIGQKQKQKQTPKRETIPPSAVVDVDDALVKLDSYILKKEKDAKLDIYNFAAQYGIIPHFETIHAYHYTRDATRGFVRHKTIKRVYKASISLPEHGINVVAVARDQHNAEAAAALEFKREAERQQMSQTKEHPTTPLPAYELLTTDTAKDFVDWFTKQMSSGAFVDFTMTLQFRPLPTPSGNSIEVLLDDKSVGTANVHFKRDALNAAALIAAITIAKQYPQILAKWTKWTNKKKATPKQSPLDLPIGTNVLGIMRDTLIHARKAGLPDQREAFGAAEEAPPSYSSQRRYVSVTARDAACVMHREKLKKFQQDVHLEQLRETKASLPMSQYTDRVMEIVSRDVYSIIIGATGSGKTTQVPQILLDQAIESGKGGYCDIICTQPRRIAASSVAQRVAAERHEKIGESVGYHVKGDARHAKPGGSITYCTTGILLEQLKWNADNILDNVSHLVIDEVHERDIPVDFLLIILKKAVQARQQAGKKVPHIVLMSATLDQKLFSEYLPNVKGGEHVPCPSLSVPGRTFPVAEKYLEELVTDITKTHKAQFESLLRADSKGISKEYIDAELNFAHKSGDTVGSAIIDWKRKQEDPESDASSPEEQRIESLVPVHLLIATLAHICNNSKDGAVLVFLPGHAEISDARKLLLEQQIFGVDFSNTTKFNIMALHSAVPPDEQKLVFEPSPPGCRKIILATNIAETSVTVPDVKFVVDLGKLREKRYDQVKRISGLKTVWESHSNARQRAGRAGRVSDGNYYALYAQQRRQTMSASGLPEIIRSDLQETCLSIKAQGFRESVTEFLAAAIEPPPVKAVDLAVQNLKSIEAFTEDEKLTSLGRILSRLPVHPNLGKMVLLGIVFRCLDPMIISSCMASERSMFVVPAGKREEARGKHMEYAQDASDHLAMINAFKDLRSKMKERGQNATWTHALQQYLHFGAFKAMEQTTQDVQQALGQAGLVYPSHQERSNGYQLGGEALNVNSNNIALIKALILAGVYPNIAIRRAGRKTLMHMIATEEKVMIHPSSMNAPDRKQLEASDFDEIHAFGQLSQGVSGDTLSMRDTTLITPLVALLFGGDLRAESFGTLVMDGWLPFRPDTYESSEYAGRLLLEFRKAKERMLNCAFRDLGDPQSGMSRHRAKEIFATGLASLLKATPSTPTQRQLPVKYNNRSANAKWDKGGFNGSVFSPNASAAISPYSAMFPSRNRAHEERAA